jgi:hypothetical protein
MLLFNANRKININQLEGGQEASAIEISGNDISRRNPKAQNPMANHHKKKWMLAMTAINLSIPFITGRPRSQLTLYERGREELKRIRSHRCFSLYLWQFLCWPP